ncbi:MAG: PTS transporter subunit EIIB [Clostridiaceae bacterium]
MDFSKMASEIVEAVGGTSNIESTTHCITRLRFVLKDKDLAKKEVIENINGVIRYIDNGEQVHLLIGNKVGIVYEETLKIVG